MPNFPLKMFGKQVQHRIVVQILLTVRGDQSLSPRCPIVFLRREPSEFIPCHLVHVVFLLSFVISHKTARFSEARPK